MSSARKFGWLSGVFTPSILTILGVIMYLRLPAIVGQAGLWATLGIIAVAHVISITTGLSVASVATDKKVEGGGTYYMISRSLGLSIGGTLGIALFVGLSFAVSLYIVGFAESFLGVLGREQTVGNIRVTGTIVLVAVTTLTFISTSLALRTQFFVLTAIALSLLSIFAGVGRHEFAAVEPAVEMLPGAAPFIVLFAIFFPAVTGFEAGVSMSGDLRDPKRAIPLGAISAILVGLVVYVLLAVFLATTVSAGTLAASPTVLTDIALIGPLVVAGVWGATLSSAMGSVLGAPRILQATSVDRVTPRFFGVGSGPAKEPRRALVVTFVIAWMGILVGELDTIARVVSMFFIATYGFLNLACAIESWASPDFRPALRVPRWVSVLGAVACLVVMIQLDVLAMIGATVILGALYFHLTRKQLQLESGDAWQGFWSSVARAALHRLDRRPGHRRNWRPNILLFAGPEGGRSHLLEFGRELAGRRGLVTNFHLVERPELGDRAAGVEPADLDGQEPPYGVFTRRVECADVYEGMADVARYYGYSGVEPNTVLIGWPRRASQEDRAAGMVRRFAELDYNVLLLDYNAERGFGTRRRVDVWLRSTSDHTGLALALAGYLAVSDAWRDAGFRYHVVGDGATGQADARRLAARLGRERLPGDVRVVEPQGDSAGLAAALSRESRDADLVVLGLADLITGPVSGPGLASGTTALDGIGSTLVVGPSRDLRDQAARAAAPARAPATDHGQPAPTTLGPLETTGNKALDAALEQLDRQLQEVASELTDGPLAAAYQEQRRLIEAAAVAIRQASGSATTPSATDGERAAREIRKARADLHYRSRRVFADYAAEGVETQAAALAAAADGLLEARDQLVEAAEKRLTLDDGRRLRWRRLVERVVATRVPRAGLGLADAFSAESSAAVTAARREITEVVSILDRLEALVRDGRDEDATELRISLTGRAGEPVIQAGEHPGAAARAEAELRGALRDAVVRVRSAAIGAASDGQSPGSGTAPRRAGAGLGARLREEIDNWAENQRLLARTAAVELDLLAFQHRAETVVRRELADLRLRIRSDVIARMDAVADALGTDEVIKVQPEPWPLPRIPAFLNRLVDALRPATAEIPESAEILADPSAGEVGGSSGGGGEGLQVALRSLVELRLESDFLGPLHGELADAGAVLERAEGTARDALRLAAVKLDEAGDAEDPARRAAMLQSARGRIDEVLEDVVALDARLAEVVPARLRSAFGGLAPHSLARLATRTPAYVRVLRRAEALPWLERARGNVRRGVGNVMGRILYQRSATLLAARGFEQRAERSPEAALPRLVAAVRPDPAVLDALPYHYRQLFLGKPRYTREFWSGWRRERELAAKAVANHRRGLGGGVAVVAEPFGGKTSLARTIAEEHYPPNRIHVVSPPPERSTDPGLFRERLREALGQPDGLPGDDPGDALARLEDAVVILDDVELWWERSDDGYGVIREMVELIRTHGKRVLFLVVADVHAFRFIEATEELDTEFLTVIESAPFSAREIGEVIDLRHSSTGLTFEYDDRPEDELSAWRRARLFNRIFDYARGSIGAALHAWIAHIRKVDGDRIVVAAPRRPDLSALDGLRPIRQLLLVQLILHRSLDRPRLARLGPLDPEVLEREVSALLRAGALVEPRPGFVAIDPFLRPHLTAWCVEKGLVP